jgi:hypothetical protein
MLKEFNSYEDLETFVNDHRVEVKNIWRIDDSDVYTDPGNPNHGKICNYVIRWILYFEWKK